MIHKPEERLGMDMEHGKKVELLAPAGNYESFLGAVHAGADAVYLGGEKFGARAYADNFTEEELCRCLRYAHLYGKKVYLTLNTLVKEKEMSELYDYLLPFYEAGLDGVIIQDMGVFQYVKEHFPGLSLHVSTQMTITGANGAEKLKQLGAERIVPARELSLKEIRLIKEKADIEIETFIHGAMCYCYSGQCLFSSILGGRSGNRGKCAQPCRLPYKTGGKEEKKKEAYYLSLKDMCTIEMIPELIEAGIDSFKIEGRMKKPEYAAGVTAMYRKYIDLYYEKGAEGFKVSKKDMEKLKALYIRSEIQDGYYHRHNGAAMVTIEKPSYSGSDEQLLKQLREQYIEQLPRMAVKAKASLRVDSPAVLQLEKDGISVKVVGKPVQAAMKQPMQEESVRKQLEKCGGTSFYMEQLSIDMDDNIFMPLKELNELRRQALELLEEKMIQENGLAYAERKEAAIADKAAELSVQEGKGVSDEFEDGIYVAVRTKQQLKAVADFLQNNSTTVIKAVFISTDLYETEAGTVKRNTEYHQTEIISEKVKGQVFAAYPYMMRHKDEWIHTCFEKETLFCGILVRNMEELSLLQGRGYRGKIVTDAGVYIWNRKAESFFEKEADLCTMPFELNSKEQKSLNEKNKLKVVYGRLPMMVTANCIRKTSGRCLKENKRESENTEELFCLTDRMGKEFPVDTQCRHCFNVIYNSVPLSLHKRTSAEAGKYRLDFTTENEQETGKILNYFCRIYEGAEENPPYKDYTTGHEKRGVE